MKQPTHILYQASGMKDFCGSRLGPLVLVNRQHPLRQSFTVNLAPPDETHPDIWMEIQASRMLAACLRAIHAAGRIVPVSGWRSHAEQQRIWDDTFAREGAEFAGSYVARPGCSEHETGLAIDLGKAAEQIDFIRPDFPDEGICGDFRRAAARYGLIERYRADKVSITGIAAEPWHFRYVGVPHAGYMEQHNLCLEEYLELLAEHSLTCRLENGRTVTVSRVTDCRTLPPAKGPRQISGDNAGGWIVTDWEAPV